MSLLLSNAYPQATGRESVYVTNGLLNEILQLEQFTTTQVSVERSINVVTALSATHNISDEEIVDYAYRPVATNAMLFDVYSHTVDWDEAQKNFMSVINQLGNRFIVMDINGDPYTEEVKSLLKECDVILYVFKPTRVDTLKAKDYIESLSEDEKLKVKLVCNLWDPLGIKKKDIQNLIKIRVNQILWFPYHVNIQRTMFEGRLCVLNRLMIEGKDQCISLRQPIKDMLSFICDSPNVKVIKEVNKWVL